MTQTSIDDYIDASPSELDKKFWKFHEDNPHVYTSLVKLAKDAYAKGHTRISINMLFEVLRWNTMIKTTTEDFKLNNSYRSRYARIIEEENPFLAGLFETRKIKS